MKDREGLLIRRDVLLAKNPSSEEDRRSIEENLLEVEHALAQPDQPSESYVEEPLDGATFPPTHRRLPRVEDFDYRPQHSEEV